MAKAAVWTKAQSLVLFVFDEYSSSPNLGGHEMKRFIDVFWKMFLKNLISFLFNF